MPQPIRFIFGLHLHQPVGNFGSVFSQHLDEVYLPFLQKVDEREFFPLVLHISGPLLEWLEANGKAYLDLVSRLVDAGRLELLCAGMYEPVLASLHRQDRIEQIGWMRDKLRKRFGIDARGLWLTERVWEPELAADLADAGVQYALVDDRHFLVTGFERKQLHAPWMTDSDGRRIALFPIDERLRYLIPFRPPAETAGYLRELASEGHRIAVLADDGEKFGGWPGTREWVYERGWLDEFVTTISALVDNGEVELSTFAEALPAVPTSGLAYLPTASYREMEGWALPAIAAQRLTNLEAELGEERQSGPEGALLRGSHWLNFLVKYVEANRMHKKMQALSLLCRDRGDPSVARVAIGRAQCNDAYWHGVFGGLYLPHLRDAIWRELAIAEKALRDRESLDAEVLDIDADGHPEIWVHSASFSAIVSPYRGGVIEEFTLFGSEVNYANTLTRRREAYHLIAPKSDGHAEGDNAGTPSIHDLESRIRLNELPPVDPEPRVLLRERGLETGLDQESYERGDFDSLDMPGDGPLPYTIEPLPDRLTLSFKLVETGITTFEKHYSFSTDGRLTATYRWSPAALEPEGVFTVEVSYRGPLEITASPSADIWSYDITTVAKSERGLEETVQGRSVTFRWPRAEGSAMLELVPAGEVESR
ncbi:MAG TPA: alpha-amylase/4-alpha-glucanotransferase domain-containing protein [Gemmatimonadales bacterium]|nr:alpha-amylase/4-alpha-glucanotransferase domain-containing protein [Gemmatimonadales bacterium]